MKPTNRKINHRNTNVLIKSDKEKCSNLEKALEVFKERVYNIMYLDLQRYNTDFVTQIERLKYKQIITQSEKEFLGYLAYLYYQHKPEYTFVGKLVDYITGRGKKPTEKGELTEDYIMENFPDCLHDAIRRLRDTNEWFE